MWWIPADRKRMTELWMYWWDFCTRPWGRYIRIICSARAALFDPRERQGHVTPHVVQILSFSCSFRRKKKLQDIILAYQLLELASLSQDDPGCATEVSLCLTLISFHTLRLQRKSLSSCISCPLYYFEYIQITGLQFFLACFRSSRDGRLFHDGRSRAGSVQPTFRWRNVSDPPLQGPVHTAARAKIRQGRGRHQVSSTA